MLTRILQTENDYGALLVRLVAGRLVLPQECRRPMKTMFSVTYIDIKEKLN